MDGEMEGWKDGWMYRQMDGWIHRLLDMHIGWKKERLLRWYIDQQGEKVRIEKRGEKGERREMTEGAYFKSLPGTCTCSLYDQVTGNWFDM